MIGIKRLAQGESVLEDSKTFLIQGAEPVELDYCADDGDPVKLRLIFKEDNPIGNLKVENQRQPDGRVNLIFNNFIDAGNSTPWRIGTTDDDQFDIYLLIQIEKLGSDKSESLNVIRRLTCSFFRMKHDSNPAQPYIESN